LKQGLADPGATIVRMERALIAVATLATAFCLAAAIAGAAQDSGASRSPGFVSARRDKAPKDALSWDLLVSYEYQPGLATLPDGVKALDGTKVVVRGYLLPLVEYDDIHEFVLVQHNMSCCFGMALGISGQIQVALAKNSRGLPNSSEMLEVRGTFRVVETKEQGILVSIYRIDDATARFVD
jgi:hypothetical protein